jgi:hypothetical protein
MVGSCPALARAGSPPRSGGVEPEPAQPATAIKKIPSINRPHLILSRSFRARARANAPVTETDHIRPSHQCLAGQQCEVHRFFRLGGNSQRVDRPQIRYFSHRALQLAHHGAIGARPRP